MADRLPPGISRRGGRFRVHVYMGVDPVTGRQRQKTGTAGTLADAKRLQARLRLEAGRGGTAAVTVAELLDRWLDAAGPDLSPSSLRAAQCHIRKHLRPGLGRFKLSRLTTAEVDRCYGRLRASGLTVGYVRRVHVTLRLALEQGRVWGWLPTNPAADARPGKGAARRVAPPSPADLTRLLDLAHADPLLALFLRLAAVTGARRGELAALRWRDLDLQDPAAASVTFQTTLVYGPAGLGARALVERPILKNTDPGKLLALDPQTAELLGGWRARCRAQALAVGRPLDGACFVFCRDPAGRTPPSPDSFSHAFARLRVQAGLPGVRLHDLRHWAATTMLTAGVPLLTAAGRLGQRDPSVTGRTYGHFLPATDQAAAALLAALLDADRNQAVTAHPVP